jgi:hypothetical protein
LLCRCIFATSNQCAPRQHRVVFSPFLAPGFHGRCLCRSRYSADWGVGVSTANFALVICYSFFSFPIICQFHLGAQFISPRHTFVLIIYCAWVLSVQGHHRRDQGCARDLHPLEELRHLQYRRFLAGSVSLSLLLLMLDSISMQRVYFCGDNVHPLVVYSCQCSLSSLYSPSLLDFTSIR